MTTHPDLAEALDPAVATDPLADADLLYGEVEEDLRGTVRDLLRDRLDPAAQIRALDSDESHDRRLWRELAGGVGLAGLLVPEDRGGAGASAREAAVVLEELGRAVAAVPFLTSAVVATTALLAAGRSAADDALGRLAAGESTAVLALPLSTSPDAAWPSAVTLDGDRLQGAVTSVADAELADAVVVPAVRGGVPVLALADGGVATPRPSLDQTRRLADLTLDGVPATVVAEGEDAVAAVRAALLTGAGLLASEQLGVAAWCLEETVAYGKVRTQFGRPVGSFQAVKHRLADVWLEVTSLRAAARYAADRLARTSATDPETQLAVAVAQAYASNVAVHAAEEALQLHGGIGMTWEHPVHLRLKRAKADQLAFGTPGRHRAAVAALVDLPPA
ncbi:MAG TPA: acyl-CoA dehydrogenase family protein [Kineosporiaceae bacterium]|nr:acyl-CoA dehydrogenase family protein [Kineosporiaceae bacterium]